MRPAAVWPEARSDKYNVVRIVRSWRLGPGARVYASPNSHLVLTYYTGVPVQSVSAVRRAWLEGFDRDLVIVDDISYDWLAPEDVVRMGERFGRTLTLAQANERSEELRWLVPALDLDGTVADLRPRPRPLDDFDRALVYALRAKTGEEMSKVVRGTPLARVATPSNWREFWQFFFYWFAQPETRLGEHLNARTRLRLSRAHVLPGGEVVYDCRPRREPPLVP